MVRQSSYPFTQVVFEDEGRLEFSPEIRGRRKHSPQPPCFFAGLIISNYSHYYKVAGFGLGRVTIKIAQ